MPTGLLKKRPILAVLTTSLATIGLSVGAGAPAFAHDRGHEGDHGGRTPTVHVHGGAATPSKLALSTRRVDAGVIRFSVDTSDAQNGSSVAMFTPTEGSSPEKVLADLQDEFSQDPQTAAKDTRELTADAVIVGLADVVKGVPATVTEKLDPGTYYLFDVNTAMQGATPVLTRLRVVPNRHQHSGRLRGDLPTIKLTSDDRFIAPNRLPAHGTVRIKNVSDTIHMADFQPVKPGTTDQDVQNFFDGTAPSPFINGPTVNMEVQSPGRQANFGYNLPKGTYVLLCFVADDQTGVPHAIMGMHKVVVLK